jgi:hypothetical protein
MEEVPMKRGLLYLALGGLLLAACGPEEQNLPTTPDLAGGRPPATGPACDYNTVKNQIVSYFSPPALQTAQGYESEMETASAAADTATVVARGFAIMDLVGEVSRAGTPSLTAGSALTKALTKCMFDTRTLDYTSLAGGKGLDSVRFDLALDPAAGGAYYVVGAGYDYPEVPHILKGEVEGFGRLSAVAAGPITVSGTGDTTYGSWTSAMSVNTANYQGGRALIYGYPVDFGPAVSDPVTFEWAAITPSTSFAQYGIVSVCDGQMDSDLMVYESSIGLLAYTTINLCGFPDATGTTKTGFRSLFTNAAVGGLKLYWVEKPASPLKVGVEYAFKVRVTTIVDGAGEQGVNGVCVALSGTNNNGQGTSLFNVIGGECPGQTNNADNQVTAVTETDPVLLKAGYANFKFYVTKTGGLVLTLSSRGALGREVGTATPLMLKYNVKP